MNVNKKTILSLFMITIISLLFTWSTCYAGANLTWDYPGEEQWGITTGYTIYYSEPDGTKFNKTIYKSDVNTENVTVVYSDIEEQLRLQPNIEYTIYLTAFNEIEESGPSNNCIYIMPGYEPQDDQLPSVIIHITGPIIISIK